MPITTYIKNLESYSDKDFKEYLPERFFIEKRVIKKLFHKPKTVYQLLSRLEGELFKDIYEYQIINFPPEDEKSDWSINTWVSKQVILAYLIGLGEKNV